MSMLDNDPTKLLYELLNSPDRLDEVPELLAYTNAYKMQIGKEIRNEIKKYKLVDLGEEVTDLMNNIRETRRRTLEMQGTINNVSSSIQSLDNCKKNLVLSMTILKRLQMLLNANEALNNVLRTHNYKEILQLFSVVRDLLNFFKPYKSIDDINKLSMYVGQTQNKLIDDIFIDFEDAVVNKKTERREQLLYGCRILETIDEKYKIKLQTWFNNLQLREIKSIFNSFEEAGSLENLNRRFIYFSNILTQTLSSYLDLFPPEWHVDLELCKNFCSATKEDLSGLVKKSISSEVLLECLMKTLDFEKMLNEKYNTTTFSHSILSVFESHLLIWVSEQGKVLQSKFVEFLSMPKIPEEFLATDDPEDFLTILKVNNLPNICNSSIEIFRLFHKILTQIIKLSNGEVLIDLSYLFIKYLNEYNFKILSPIFPTSEEHYNGILSIKYITMLLNTGDYIINNINDLQDKFINLIQPALKDRIKFDSVIESYYQLINKSMICLLNKNTFDMKFAWRQFANANWSNMESTKEHSIYIGDLVRALTNNSKLILPLIIRDSYSKSFCNKLVELLTTSFLNNLRFIKPISLINIEQLKIDTMELKRTALTFPFYANPNYSSNGGNQEPSNLYVKFVNNQFHKIETVLKVISTPTLPVDNIIEVYFQLIGDKSIRNFTKILNLMNIEKTQYKKYTESFKLQLTLDNELIDESPILSVMDDDSTLELQVSDSVVISRKGTPELKSPKLPQLKINNLEKNFREFALNGENHVNKFNENFKNFGKFFRKDNND